MSDESPPDGVRWARWLALLAAVAYLCFLLVFRWWPQDFVNSRFLEYRAELLQDVDFRGNYPDSWNILPVSFYRFGFVLAILAMFAAPWAIAARGWWHWPAGLAVTLAAVWHATAIFPFGLINTTPAPYLALLASSVPVGCWIVVRSALFSARAAESPSHSHNELGRG